MTTRGSKPGREVMPPSRTFPARGGGTWQRKLAEAQRRTHYAIGPRRYPRIAYGDPREGGFYEPKARPLCHDCLAAFGELHVPGCDVERCPACGGQMISCGHVSR